MHKTSCYTDTFITFIHINLPTICKTYLPIINLTVLLAVTIIITRTLGCYQERKSFLFLQHLAHRGLRTCGACEGGRPAPPRHRPRPDAHLVRHQGPQPAHVSTQRPRRQVHTQRPRREVEWQAGDVSLSFGTRRNVTDCKQTCQWL